MTFRQEREIYWIELFHCGGTTNDTTITKQLTESGNIREELQDAAIFLATGSSGLVRPCRGTRGTGNRLHLRSKT